MSVQKRLTDLRNSYQEMYEWYKGLGDKALASFYQNEVKECDRLIQIEQK